MLRKKCIGVLTSGGDSPGMNAAIRSVVRSALSRGMDAVGIYKGYNGLLNCSCTSLDARSVSNILKCGGTILKTARCMDFYKPEVVAEACGNCKKLGLDGIVVIGGDGSFRGARDLSRAGIPCIGIPGTIDNDIACSDYTIGYDTAMNTALELIDRLNDTCQSHERCSVVEVMGRHAGHVALNTGIACGAIRIITEEVPCKLEEIAEHIREVRKTGKDHFIIVVSEGHGHTEEIAKKIEELTGIESRATVFGHVQRGGSPTLRDRVVASRMGHYAVELFARETGSRIVAVKNGQLVDYDIEEALSMKKGLDLNTYRIMQDIAF